jgi:hypothetical protein
LSVSGPRLAGRGALDPLLVLSGQVILAVAGCRLAAGGGRRQLVLARAGVMNCPSLSRMISRCLLFAGAGKSTCANIEPFKPDWISLGITQPHSATLHITGWHLR